MKNISSSWRSFNFNEQHKMKRSNSNKQRRELTEKRETNRGVTKSHEAPVSIYTHLYFVTRQIFDFGVSVSWRADHRKFEGKGGLIVQKFFYLLLGWKNLMAYRDGNLGVSWGLRWFERFLFHRFCKCSCWIFFFGWVFRMYFKEKRMG